MYIGEEKEREREREKENLAHLVSLGGDIWVFTLLFLQLF